MKNPDYAAFMETQQKFNLAIMRRLNELGANFAFPTQTLHVASLPKMT
jgi:small-conductance mechanosensitive channel